MWRGSVSKVSTLKIETHLIDLQEIIDICAVSESHVAAFVNRIGQHFLQFLSDYARMILCAVQLVIFRELRVVLISHNSNLIDIFQLLARVHLRDVVLDASVAGLNDVPRDFNIAVDHQTLVGHIGIDANFALMTYRALRYATLPTAQVHFALKLARIRGPNDYSFARVTNDRKVARVGVRVKSNDKLEIALFRIGAPLLAHIVACRLREVESADGYFAHLSVLKVNAVLAKRKLM